MGVALAAASDRLQLLPSIRDRVLEFGASCNAFSTPHRRFRIERRASPWALTKRDRIFGDGSTAWVPLANYLAMDFLPASRSIVVNEFSGGYLCITLLLVQTRVPRSKMPMPKISAAPSRHFTEQAGLRPFVLASTRAPSETRTMESDERQMTDGH